MAVRGVLDDPFASRSPTPESGHVGFDPGFVEENQAARVDAGDAKELKLGPLGDDIRPPLLGRVESFF
jgi:hypothetical protein